MKLIDMKEVVVIECATAAERNNAKLICKQNGFANADTGRDTFVSYPHVMILSENRFQTVDKRAVKRAKTISYADFIASNS